MFHAAGFDVLAGGDAEGTLEDALEVLGTERADRTEFIEGEAFVQMGVDKAADAFGHISIISLGIRAAPLAGTKASGFGLLGVVAEGDVAAVGGAGGTGWAAVDAGGMNGGDEAAIVGTIPILDGLPTFIIGEDGGGWG